MATMFFDLTTNLVVQCIPGREEGGVFNYEKNKNGEDNDDKDDEDVNNDNKFTSGQEPCVGYLPMGGRSQTWYDAFLTGRKGDYNEDDDDLSRQ